MTNSSSYMETIENMFHCETNILNSTHCAPNERVQHCQHRAKCPIVYKQLSFLLLFLFCTNFLREKIRKSKTIGNYRYRYRKTSSSSRPPIYYWFDGNLGQLLKIVAQCVYYWTTFENRAQCVMKSRPRA